MLPGGRATHSSHIGDPRFLLPSPGVGMGLYQLPSTLFQTPPPPAMAPLDQLYPVHKTIWLLCTRPGSKAYAAHPDIPRGLFFDEEHSMGQRIQLQGAAHLKSCLGSPLEPGQPGCHALHQPKPQFLSLERSQYLNELYQLERVTGRIKSD